MNEMNTSPAMKKDEPTIRRQKIKKNHTFLRLIIFSVLALLLLFGSIFADALCPYDPYEQDL